MTLIASNETSFILDLKVKTYSKALLKSSYFSLFYIFFTEYTGSEIMIVSPSRAKTVRVMGKSTSYSDSTSKNTFKKFISLIKRRWFGLQLQL